MVMGRVVETLKDLHPDTPVEAKVRLRAHIEAHALAHEIELRFIRAGRLRRAASRASTQERLSWKTCHKAIQKSDLPLHDTLTGILQGEPISAIHLGKFLHVSGLRRPFHRKRVTSYCLGRAIAFESPGRNYLSAR